jgi:hypothetical protein
VGKRKMRKCEGEEGRKEGRKDWPEENKDGWTERRRKRRRRKIDGESWRRMKIPPRVYKF